jgi:N6-L-threonylcarbamoyladenine synthase
MLKQTFAQPLAGHPSNVVSSQILIHQKYGGVVPEPASRRHIESIVPVVSQALEEAKVTLGEIDGIGVIHGPGLRGSLLVKKGSLQKRVRS